MAYKDIANQRASQRRHYLANKEAYTSRLKVSNARLKQEMKQLLHEAKAQPCMDCGIEYPPYVMDFDHRDPSEKLFGVTKGVGKMNKAALFAEIAKCDLVCANCHRKRTFGGII